MWREPDVRRDVPERPDLARGGRGASDRRATLATDPREVFSQDLDLPRGEARERVPGRERAYLLSGSEARTLATVGAFRLVPAGDLRDADGRPADARTGDLRHLRDQGLVTTTPLMLGRERATGVTLTEAGRRLLDEARTVPSRDGQTFFAGAGHRREQAHNAYRYRAYLRAADRLVGDGARLRRVVLEDELKAAYQRACHGRAGGDPEAIARWAREHALPVDDGHVQFPDVRLEYEDRDGRARVEDLEVTTPHYRGAHAAAKARAGFTRYRTLGVRVGGRGGGAGRGGGGRDPHLAEEVIG